MTRADAKKRAQAEAKRSGLRLALVQEGPHADEFAKFDADGQSYGYCPLSAAPMLYKWGKVIEEVSP